MWLMLSLPVVALAFPGVVVSTQSARPLVDTTHVVVMKHAGVTIITIMADYRGPRAPFALLLPVPSDVTRDRLKTVKHEFVSRLEEVSAPRFAEFWEQDPCDKGPVEQDWETKIAVKGRGFLTPKVMPPRDAKYPISNELSIPHRPIFKGSENEFSYRLLRPKTAEELQQWLRLRGYYTNSSMAALTKLVGLEMQLLFAEVLIDHVELIDSDHLQLGGIRYWTKQPVDFVPVTLGLSHLDEMQDLFIYVLDRERRFEAANYANVFAPTNLAVDPELAGKIGPMYNALFDRTLARHSAAFVTEFIGFSDRCGEPCPNAPLQLRELLTLGGDVLEEQTVSATERKAIVSAQASEELQKSWADLSPVDRRQAEREYKQHQQRLAERRALLARQKYLLTRLHYRYDASTLPRDVRLRPTSQHVEGGFGVPRGPGMVLPLDVKHASRSKYQVRLASAHAWRGTMECTRPLRWRWGKRWKSHSQHWRKVHIARDLPRVGRDPALLKTALITPLPALGLTGKPTPKPTHEASPPGLRQSDSSGCAMHHGELPYEPGSMLVLLAVCCVSTRLFRCRSRFNKHPAERAFPAR